MSEDEENEILKLVASLPRWAFLEGKGSVQVLGYRGDGRFMVLTSRDEKVFVHRDRLKFKKG